MNKVNATCNQPIDYNACTIIDTTLYVKIGSEHCMETWNRTL